MGSRKNGLRRLGDLLLVPLRKLLLLFTGKQAANATHHVQMKSTPSQPEYRRGSVRWKDYHPPPTAPRRNVFKDRE